MGKYLQQLPVTLRMWQLTIPYGVQFFTTRTHKDKLFRKIRNINLTLNKLWLNHNLRLSYLIFNCFRGKSWNFENFLLNLGWLLDTVLLNTGSTVLKELTNTNFLRYAPIALQRSSDEHVTAHSWNDIRH